MNIAVYLGSSEGSQPVYVQEAEKLGRWLGRNGHTLVYGGASVGTMGKLAQAVLQEKGNVIGVMPRFMINGHKEYEGLTQFIITEDMSSRKKKMLDLADAYIALPGGPGTLEEVSEVISSIRLGLISGNCYILNTDGYYNPLKKQLEVMEKHGFLHASEINRVFFVNTVEELEEKIGDKHA